MKRIAILLVLVMGLASTSAARSQQPASSPIAKTSATTTDSVVSLKPSPELQKSLDDLAQAMQSLALKITTDPQIKAAAISVASGFVATAQQVLTEQSDVIQQALKTAAERISAAQSNLPQHPRKP